jgi:hypothetical protein
LSPAEGQSSQGRTWYFRKEIADISIETQREITAFQKAIFVWGEATYVDIFGATQALRFRYRTQGNVAVHNPGEKPTLIGWALHPEEEGNDST